jgi:large repetitive protein
MNTVGGGFNGLSGVAVDGSGNVYVADYNNNAVKEMPPGCASSSCVTTLGEGFNNPQDVALDGSGNVYIADFGNSLVKEMPPGCASLNCVTTLGGAFNRPYGVAADQPSQRRSRSAIVRQRAYGLWVVLLHRRAGIAVMRH